MCGKVQQLQEQCYPGLPVDAVLLSTTSTRLVLHLNLIIKISFTVILLQTTNYTVCCFLVTLV